MRDEVAAFRGGGGVVRVQGSVDGRGGGVQGCGCAVDEGCADAAALGA